MKFNLTSPAFTHEGEIPVKHTCDGENVSPPLQWAGIPEGTQSLSLIVIDPDAPHPLFPIMTWTHWVLYNIPPSATNLDAGVRTAELPPGTLEGLNDWKRTGYGGPCPPLGRHRYFFKLFALDTVLPDLGTPTRKVLEKAMKGHILAEALLVGTYRRQSG